MFPAKHPQAIRSRVTFDEIEGLQITIPAARSWPMVLFLGVWLVGWIFGELVGLGTLAAQCFGLAVGFQFHNPGEIPFITFWLIFWTLGGAFVMYVLNWQLRGRETIQIDPDGQSLVIRRLGTFLPRRTRVYPLEEVHNLRYAPLSPVAFPPFGASFRESWEAQLQWFGAGGGSIGFDYAGRTERFGSQLSETESRRLIKTIKDHYKIPDDKDEPLPVERF